MNCDITRCATEMYAQKYIEFLIEHYKQLKLPYPFPVLLGFVASPVTLGGETFLIYNDDYEVVGAFGYISGTGENEYEDKHVIQIQAALILEEYRKTSLFLKGLQYLTQYIAQLNQTVKEVRFWTPAQDELRRLLAKLTLDRNTHETVFGQLDEYRVSFSALQAYASKFRQIRYF